MLVSEFKVFLAYIDSEEPFLHGYGTRTAIVTLINELCLELDVKVPVDSAGFQVLC